MLEDEQSNAVPLGRGSKGTDRSGIQTHSPVPDMRIGDGDAARENPLFEVGERGHDEREGAARAYPATPSVKPPDATVKKWSVRPDLNQRPPAFT